MKDNLLGENTEYVAVFTAGSHFIFSSQVCTSLCQRLENMLEGTGLL